MQLDLNPTNTSSEELSSIKFANITTQILWELNIYCSEVLGQDVTTFLDQFGCQFINFGYRCVKEKFKFFVICYKWPQQSRKFHYEALKTLKMLCFLVLCQWTLPQLCIWTLPGGSQLPVHLSYLGNSLSHTEDCHSKLFSEIVPKLHLSSPHSAGFSIMGGLPLFSKTWPNP